MSRKGLLHEAERIVMSDVMKGSSTYSTLLLYLVKATEEGRVPKETTIALDIFGRQDFDPSQSTLIRVYIYHLRKKLDTYYNTIGLHQKQRLCIPKGNYKICLEERPNRGFGLKRVKPWYFAATISLMALVFFLVKALNIGKSPTPINGDGLWRDLLVANIPITVVIGDFYIFRENNSVTSEYRFIRDPEINSVEDYDGYVRHTGDSLHTNKVNFSMVPFYSNFWVKDLSHVFNQYDRTFSLRTGSRFNPIELQDHNVIVVGMLKTLGMFQNYFDNSDYSLNENYYLVYQDPESGTKTTYTPSGNPNQRHKDYSFIAKVPGPGANNIFLFGGLWDIGADEGLKNFTNPKLRNFLEKKMQEELGHIPDYYEILLEANGYERMGIDSRVIRVNEIQEDKVVWDFKLEKSTDH